MSHVLGLRVTPPGRTESTPPDDYAEDITFEMANLNEKKTRVPGTIYISSQVGSHGPRVKWYPHKASRTGPCLIISIEEEPTVRDDYVASVESRRVTPLVKEWVRLNHAALIDFWEHGDTWDTDELREFLDNLHPRPGS